MAGSTALHNQGTSISSGSVFLITSDGRTLSLPIPSKSRRDPLNWSSRKRAGALLSVAVFAVCGLTSVQAPSLILNSISVEFEERQGTLPICLDLVALASTLSMGLGTFLWIPLSLAIGRRSVLLFATLMLLASTTWIALAESFIHVVIGLALQAFANGLSTSAVLLIAIDLTFIHQRLHALAMVWSLAGVVTMLILTVMPHITRNGNNWRLFYHVWILLISVSFIISFCLFPETHFVRPAVAFDGRVLLQDASEKLEIYPDWESAHVEKELPDTPSAGWKIWLNERKFCALTEGGWEAMRQCYVQIFLCAINPMILWVTVLNSLVFGGMIHIASTYAHVLLAPPYNMKINTISLVNISGAVGALLAWPASGILIARVIRRLAMRNKGVREAHHHVLAFILPVIASSASLIIYGLAADKKLHFILIYVAYTLTNFSFTTLAAANTIWIAEACPRNAAAGLAVVVGGSYMLSAPLRLALIPWVKHQGLAGADVELAGITLFVGFVGVPLSFYGKKLRQSIHARWAKHQEGSLKPQ